MNFQKAEIIKSIQFVFLSGIGWLIDFSIFTFCVRQLEWDIFNANCLSSFIAVTLVFFISTKSIFDKKKSDISLTYKYISYIVYQIILIILISWLAVPLNQFILSNFHTFGWMKEYSALITKVLITPITMILNFVAMKILIEKL